MSIYSHLKNYISYKNKMKSAQKEWRENNKDNFTTISEFLPSPVKTQDVINVGKGTYGCINVRWFWDKKEHLSIGNFCSIAEGVVFLTGGNHPMKTLSSFPFDCYYTERAHLAPTKGPIVIEDDVWIGLNAIVLSGVRIGQGAVIGANSVVAKEVPPYAIYVGNKVVKYRFSDDIIEKLLKFDYSKLTEEDIKDNIELLSKEIDESFFDTEFYKSHLKR